MGYLFYKFLNAGCTPFLNKFEKDSLFNGSPKRYFQVVVLYYSGNSPYYLSIYLSFCILN